MQRFIREFTLTTTYLPHEHRSDFGALIQCIDPVVQGSLRATLQPLHHNNVCLQEITDWTQPTSVVLPPSYILYNFDQACISELVIVLFPLS